MSEAQTPRLILYTRKEIEVNTDPQRRCYYGAHAQSEMQWTAWGWLELDVPPDKVEARLQWWRDLNAYSVSIGGRRSEYKVEPGIVEVL